MELNAGEIKKALKCCGDGSINGCQGCPRNYSDPCETADCRERLMRDAISVIRELAEENGNLRASTIDYRNIPYIVADTRADTVRKMQERVKQAICDNTYPDFDKNGKPVNIWKATTGYDAIDQIAKEMLEEA